MNTAIRINNRSNKIISVFLYSWLFYFINCLLFARDSIPDMIVGFLTTSVLIFGIFSRMKQLFNPFVSLLCLLIITLPVSFRSIFCTGYGQIPLPWFYLLLLFMLILILTGSHSVRAEFFVLLLLLLIPMLLSDSIIEGFKEYLGYASFCVGGILAYKMKSFLSEEEFSICVDLYINGVIFVSLGVLTQYVALNRYNLELFNIERYYYGRNLFMFLFYDMSGNTVYMATAIIFLLYSKRNGKYFLSAIIGIAMAACSARGGFVALSITLILIIIFGNSKSIKKIPLILFAGLLVTVGFAVLLSTRSKFSSVGDMLASDNGRIKLISIALQYFLHSPIFGCGLDFGKQMRALGFAVPHIAIVNLLAQTGLIITTLFVVILIRGVNASRYYKNQSLFWCYILCTIGSMVSPSFFDLRFFTVIYMLCFMCPQKECRYG